MRGFRKGHPHFVTREPHCKPINETLSVGSRFFSYRLEFQLFTRHNNTHPLTADLYNDGTSYGAISACVCLMLMRVYEKKRIGKLMIINAF